MSLPASQFNAPGQPTDNVFITPKATPVALRYMDGSPTGFTIAADQLHYGDGAHSGQLRLDYHELLDSTVGRLVFHRGGGGYVDSQNTKSGHVWIADLVGPLGSPQPSGGGRGDPAPLAPAPHDGVFTASAQSIPLDMYYKPPVGDPALWGATWRNYGDPASDQGDRHDVHYSYLLWSCPDVSGGGKVRALIGNGQLLRQCDVERLKLPSYGANGQVNGEVALQYVRRIDQDVVFGWMVWAHRYTGGAWTYHAQ